MGVLPLEFVRGECRESLGLSGLETFDIEEMEANFVPGRLVKVTAHTTGRGEKTFMTKARIDTPFEWSYYEHGGICSMSCVKCYERSEFRQ